MTDRQRDPFEEALVALAVARREHMRELDRIDRSLDEAVSRRRADGDDVSVR